MNIAIIGYGKMGHAVERIALQRGHNVVARIDADNPEVFDSPEFLSADCAIEFSTPATAASNILAAASRGVKVVSGSTGWTDLYPEVAAKVAQLSGSLLWSSNFSIGVNVFAAVNRYLASIMASLPQYSPAMLEVHHTHKLDHPSGTAITLAQGILKECARVGRWAEEPDGRPDTLVVSHQRRGEVPGTHIVSWDSPVDSITIEHRAYSRDGFALGAVMGAEWLANRNGVFSIDDMMESIIQTK